MAIHNSQHDCNNSMDCGLHLRCLKKCAGYIQIAPDGPFFLLQYENRRRKDMGLSNERKKNTYMTKVIIVLTI